MTTFKFSDDHETEDPPTGVVRGKFVAREGRYDVKIVYQESGRLFAGPVADVIVPSSRKLDLAIKINRRTMSTATELRIAKVTAMFKEHSADDYEEGDSLMINYRL
jgi:hypothetical protein